jgi:hypothetical protein
MTTEELRAEVEWMRQYIADHWQGCKPYSRFARSLPAVLDWLLTRLNDTGKGDDR